MIDWFVVIAGLKMMGTIALLMALLAIFMALIPTVAVFLIYFTAKFVLAIYHGIKKLISTKPSR